MITWKEITHSKAKGGLDICPFVVQAQALKIRHVNQLIDNKKTKWISIASSLIVEDLKKGPHKKERKHRKIVDAILLNPKIHIPNSPTLRGMLKGWAVASKELQFRFQENSLPNSVVTEQLLMLYDRNYDLEGVMKAL